MSDDQTRDYAADEDHEALLGSNAGSFIAPMKRTLWNIIWRGPAEPRDPHVTMVWPAAQEFPDKLSRSLPRRLKVFLVVVSWLLCLGVNVLIAHEGVFAVSCDLLHSDSQTCGAVESLQCGHNSYIWAGPGGQCGLDGYDCMEGQEGELLAFRCPSNCQNDGRVYQLWNVGDEMEMRVPLAIGGPDVYRGDSFICVAALHAGVISRYKGGCGKLRWVGSHSNFTSTPSVDGRFWSVGFDSEYPLNFEFVRDENERFTKCRDIRSIHIAVNAVFILLFAYFLTSPVLFLYTLILIGFWTIILASNPPWFGGTPEANNELISLGFRRLLPCLLSALYIYEFATKRQLRDMPASLSRAVFWGGGFIIGILENFVFGAIPVDRLIISDLDSQPGAWLAVFVIGGLVIVIAVGQAYLFWRKGVFRKYITAYLLGIFFLVGLSLWPGLVLRIHHYILALALLPGTGLQSTPSLFYQGLLVGLYVAGVARWDFDSILQTVDQLNRGGSEARPLSDPQFVDPVNAAPGSFVAEWEGHPDQTFSGYSVLVNDVERHRGAENTFNLTEWASTYLGDNEPPSKWYLRVAAAHLGRHDEGRTGSYSEPLIVYDDGTYELR